VTIASDSTGQIALAAGTNVIGHVIVDSGAVTATGSGTFTVGGVAASGASASGNPVMVGGVFNTTQPTVTTGQVVDLQATARGGLIVATGTDTFHATIDNATIAVTGTFWQATQPVSGTVTANAGTNLNTSALALESGGNLATIAGAIISQEATTSGVKGVTVFGAVTTNAPSYTTAKSDALSLDTSGLLRVSLKDTPANTNKLLVTADAVTFASPQHVIVDSGTVTTVSTVTNLAQLGGTAISMNSGTRDAGTQRVTIATNDVVPASQSGPWTVATNADCGLAAGSAPSKALVIAGVYNTSLPTPTNGQTVALQLDGSGYLKTVVENTVNVNAFQSGTWNIGTVTTLTNAVSTNADTGVGSGSAPSKAFLIAAVHNTSLPTLGDGQTAALQADASGRLLLTANQTVSVSQIAGNSVATAATGTQKVGIVGSAAATMDGTVGAGSAPTNCLIVGTVYNTSAPAPTNSQSLALQADNAGNLKVIPGIASVTGTVWNTSTALNTTQILAQNTGAPAVSILLAQTSTLSAGAVTFEGSYDGTNWITVPAAQVVDPSSLAQITIPYTLQANTNKAFLLFMGGFQQLRAKLSTAITGSGAVTLSSNQVGYEPALQMNASGAAKVDGSGVTQPVSGTVTANAGTNLNTAALALESGGNLATLAGGVSSSKYQVNIAQVAGGTASNAGQTGALQVGGAVATNTAVSSASYPLQVAGSDYGGTPKIQTIKVDSSGIQYIGGDTASGATDGGYPVKIGGVANNAAPSAVSVGQRVNLWSSLYGGTVIQPYMGAYNSDNVASTPGQIVDHSGNGRPQVGVGLLLNSAGNYDRPRNNQDATLLSSAARTATTACSDQVNYNGRGVRIVLSVTVASGSGGLQVQIQGKDSISGNYYQLNATPTAVIATGTYVYDLFPAAITAQGGITQATDQFVPRTWRVNVVHGDASSYTYSVSGVTIL
jgi:hypothetical protein